jgi:Galactose oxidase, central domain
MIEAGRRHKRRRRRLIRSGAIVTVAVGVAVYFAVGSSGTKAKGPARRVAVTVPPAITTTSVAPPAGPVTTRTLAVHLPGALSRSVVASDGTGVVILGGLDSRGRSSAAALRFDPVAGTVQQAGTLAVAAHDAAGVRLGAAVLIFGGGSETASIRSVQSYQGGRTTLIGSLPVARSDLAAIATGSGVVVLGGFDGHTSPASVLSTADGVTFQVVAQLPLPVRYPGIVASGSKVYVIGGESQGTPTTDIQAVDVAAGTASIVGHLPVSLSHQSVFTLGGSIYLAGGRSAGTTVATIWRFDPATNQVMQEGTLPVAMADAPAAVVGATAYLFGGEAPARSSSIVAVTPAPAP